MEILRLLKKNPNYGYKIAKELRKSVEGIYVHLNDLEKEKFIVQEKMNDKRNYYKLTEKGIRLLDLIDGDIS